MHTTEYAIEIENLEKCYVKDVKVLDNVSFTVKKGEIVGYLGPNGSGKTTTIKILTNLLSPTSGHAYINGIDTNKNPKEALKPVGALIEVPGIYDYLTPHDVLSYYGKVHGMERRKIDARIEEVLKTVRLSDWEHKKLGAFSTGMQRRLAIATTILHEPKILILDEPAIGLDPKGMKEIRDMLKQLQKEGTTIFLSSHLLNEVSDTCDKVIFLDRTEVIAYDTVENIKNMMNVKRIEAKFLDQLTTMDLDRIKAITSVNEVEVANGRIHIGFDGKQETSHRILAELISSGFRISSYAPVMVSLEDFYVSVMSDEMGVG